MHTGYNDMITDKVIDHISDNKKDNRLSNLKLITTQENNKKSEKNRDYTFVQNNHKNRKYVRAINLNTTQFLYFNSLYSVKQHLRINFGMVKMICRGLNSCKSTYSKNYNKYTFPYITEQQLPKDYKSDNKRPRKISEEEKNKNRIESIKKWKKTKNIYVQNVIRK